MLDQLLQALVAVHAVGVVHGDVKPANLLLDADRSPAGRTLRLADFGDDDGPSGPVGAGYLAPEQEAGAPAHPSQDVYAAGRARPAAARASRAR